MANAKICDLCGGFYVPNGHHGSYGLFGYGIIADELKDLCPKCECELEEFVDKKIKECDKRLNDFVKR